LAAHLRLVRGLFLESFKEFRAGGVTLINADRVFSPDSASGDIGREGLIDLLPAADDIEAVLLAESTRLCVE
jgi:hypothetical protein